MSDSKYGAKVRALLDTADSYRAEGKNEAADSYEAKAAELMVKYRVEQEETLAHDEASEKPVQRDFNLAGMGSKYRANYAAMWYWIAQHCEVETWQAYVYSDDGYKLMAHAVGYAGDLEYAEMLFTSARLVFTDKLEPKVDPKLSDQVNAYRLRASGMERVRVAQTLWGNTDKLFLARVGRLYKAECEARGEEAMLSGRGVTGKAYREQYADAFVTTLHSRLWSARQAASASGGGLVLHGRKERIKEAFYTFYPDQKPKPALEYKDPRDDCAKCKAAKSGECREHHIPMGRSSAGPDYNSVAAERGRMAGRAAARDVQVNRSAGTKELS